MQSLIHHPKVSAWAADGVAKYLRFEHWNTVLSCVGAVAMHANLLAQNEATANSKKNAKEFLTKGTIQKTH